VNQSVQFTDATTGSPTVPGSPAPYRTSNGANGFDLYDMQGNVWQLANDSVKQPLFAPYRANSVALYFRRGLF
jgi:formylglycine-generating enzyme required for sulfatase activity